MKLTIVIPRGATTQTDNGLVALTKYLTKKVFKSERQGGGFLGGEYGYGVDYENDTFMMHSFCWCEQDDCGWCNAVKPNFLFKPTGCKVFWYKYIGRSMEKRGRLPKNWLEVCKKSIKNGKHA